jgi:hypothetical protein
MLSLTDPGGGILYVFHDDNQNLYRRANAFPAGMMEIPLRDNLRNTQKISDLTAKSYRGDPMRARVHLVVIATDETMKRLGLAGSD